ncbi:hypothetical protein, partial [Dyella acidisoli]|uniref:hypothetical protein n=1 Tax=Dyella acidisoli TaxID=1867834 RepID=UPI0024E128E6
MTFNQCPTIVWALQGAGFARVIPPWLSPWDLISVSPQLGVSFVVALPAALPVAKRPGHFSLRAQ